ncbi:MAG: hypothetical protein NT029_19430 [Armatimonadetes bacterium]|nr:hypothetical protein [Armatimonadota bacterium]
MTSLPRTTFRTCRCAAWLVIAILAAETAWPKPSEPPADTPAALQPFTLDLLDVGRGRWRFIDAFGQNLEMPGALTAWAYPAGSGPLTVSALYCDPEKPEDAGSGEWRRARQAPSTGGVTVHRIDEPWFKASIRLEPQPGGAVRCTLSDVRLGPATAGDRYVSRLGVRRDGRDAPLWLAAPGGATIRVMTDRVGGVFGEAEGMRVRLVSPAPLAEAQRLYVEVRDMALNRIAWKGAVRLRPGSPAMATLVIPATRCGVFEVLVSDPTGLKMGRGRVCRVATPRAVKPEASTIGINLFQQQVWWYAHQAPLLAKAGVHWIRPWLAWENTWSFQQPTADVWEMRPLDASLRRMDRFGMRYQSILFGAPSWLTGSRDWTAPPPEKLAQWEAYVTRLVTRFRGRIPAYEMWNEPDLMWQEATRHSGEHYLSLLRTGYRAAKKADPKCLVLGLSHAGYEEWLERVGKLGAAPYFDIATLHTYAEPDAFLEQAERRKAILRRRGMGAKPIWFNEFGTTANDFSPDYSKEYRCSERRQAEVLVANYAQALSVGKGAKAFWFCSLDPRDPAHKDQWTVDAGIGVLYLGLLPKLAYAALAGMAQQLDARPCVGAAEPLPGVRMVAFDGPVCVVWAEARSGLTRLPAVRLGCTPGERIVVRDLLANRIAAGPADGVALDFAQGPLYITGSRQLGAAVRAGTAATPLEPTVTLAPGQARTVRLTAGRGATVAAATPAGSGITARARAIAGGWTVELRAAPGTPRASARVRVETRFPRGAYGLLQPLAVTRWIAVTVGAPNLVRDGGFDRGSVAEWTPERTSASAHDRAEGKQDAGSLRLDGPFDRRLVHWNLGLKPGREAHLSCWVKTRNLAGAAVTLSVALFSEKEWIGSHCLASTTPDRDVAPNWRVARGCAHVPMGTNEWTLLTSTLPADAITQDLRKAALFIDVSGGGSGTIWFDDVDLWQEEQ